MHWTSVWGEEFKKWKGEQPAGVETTIDPSAEGFSQRAIGREYMQEAPKERDGSVIIAPRQFLLAVTYDKGSSCRGGSIMKVVLSDADVDYIGDLRMRYSRSKSAAVRKRLLQEYNSFLDGCSARIQESCRGRLGSDCHSSPYNKSL